MFSLSTWIWLIERNDLVDFVPNGYDRILLALTPQRPNIDFGLFIRPFTVQAWRGIGITFAIIITCIILPYMTLRGLHYSNTDRYVLSGRPEGSTKKLIQVVFTSEFHEY